MATQTVVTYRGAYTSTEMDLCAEHETSDAAGMSLGMVQHGAHQGYCDVCHRSATREASRPAELRPDPKSREEIELRVRGYSPVETCGSAEGDDANRRRIAELAKSAGDKK